MKLQDFDTKYTSGARTNLFNSPEEAQIYRKDEGTSTRRKHHNVNDLSPVYEHTVQAMELAKKHLQAQREAKHGPTTFH